MIISASYKTDIPAFYGRWLINRLRAGYCKTFNSYSGQDRRVDLTPPAVDGIVFWTKNMAPFVEHLGAVSALQIPFVVQYTINSYPKVLEQSVVEAQRSIIHMKHLADTFGPQVAVWRYDPIIFSSVTPISFHLKNFERLAKSLQGTTDEVVISFAQVYRKTLHNMNAAAREYSFCWEDPAGEIKQNLADQLAEIASTYEMHLKMCAQRTYTSPIIGEAQCISKIRMAAVGGKPITARTKGNRPECACSEAIDIGEYDTCPHGCVYCYAVRNRQIAKQRFSQHDPEGEFLFTPSTDHRGPKQPETNPPSEIKSPVQLTMMAD